MENRNITVSGETRKLVEMKMRMDTLWGELELMAAEVGTPNDVVGNAFLALADIYDKYFVMEVRERISESGGTVM